MNLINCVFSGNYASYGGAIRVEDNAELTAINCAFVNNYSISDAALSVAGVSCGGNCTIDNSILWANSNLFSMDENIQVSSTVALNHSTVMGWTGLMGGVGNNGDDPLLIDADGPDNIAGTDDDDLRLQVGSPCIDAGGNAAVIGVVSTDLDGGLRFADDPDTDDTGAGTPPIVDRGAYEWTDCNDNDVDDGEDIAAETSADCNRNSLPDECEPYEDCNNNGTQDICDVANRTSYDCQPNGIPDECETDCQPNGIGDECEIASGSSTDMDGNGLPDECDPDCNSNGLVDACDLFCGQPGAPCSIPDCGLSADCTGNGVPDECEPDCDGNGNADSCDILNCEGLRWCQDCQANGIPDQCDISAGTSLDADGNEIADECDRLPGPQPGGPGCGDAGDCTGSYEGADCIAGVCYIPKNRYLSIDPTTNLGLVAYQVEIVEAAHYPTTVGRTWWLDTPACYDYPNGEPVPGATTCAGADLFGWVSKLGSTPITRVWTEIPLHITGCGIVPDVFYEIRTSPDQGIWLSDPLAINTAWAPESQSQSWGDVTGGPVPGMPGLWLPPDRATSFSDIGNAIRTFENRAEDTGFPPRVWVDMEIDQVVSLADISFLIMAFEGRAYADIQLDLIGVNPADCPP